MRSSTLARRFHTLDRRMLPGFTRHLRRFFAGQAGRVVATYLALDFLVNLISPKPQPAAETILPDSEKQALYLAMLPFLLQASLGSGALAGALVGLEALTEQDPRVAELLNDVGSRIAGIHRTTLEAVRTALSEGFQRGYSAQQIADGVAEDSFRGLRAVVTETYKGRAETIARTELARMTSLAALSRYQEAGASEVYVLDGMTNPTPCGWLEHNDPDIANDTWRTVIDAQQHPLAHPNCSRRFLPPKPGRNRIPQLPAPPTRRRPRITVTISMGGRER